MSRKKSQSTDTGKAKSTPGRQKFSDLTPASQLIDITQNLEISKSNATIPVRKLEARLSAEQYAKYTTEAEALKKQKFSSKQLTGYMKSVNAVKAAIEEYIKCADAVNQHAESVAKLNKKADGKVFDAALKSLALPKEGGKTLAELQGEYLKALQKQIATEIANS